MTHTAHIQASIVPADAGAEEFYEGHPGHVWQLCCEESERNQRRRELALLTSESNALKALLAMHIKPAPRREQADRRSQTAATTATKFETTSSEHFHRIERSERG